MRLLFSKSSPYRSISTLTKTMEKRWNVLHLEENTLQKSPTSHRRPETLDVCLKSNKLVKCVSDFTVVVYMFVVTLLHTWNVLVFPFFSNFCPPIVVIYCQNDHQILDVCQIQNKICQIFHPSKEKCSFPHHLFVRFCVVWMTHSTQWVASNKLDTLPSFSCIFKWNRNSKDG